VHATRLSVSHLSGQSQSSLVDLSRGIPAVCCVVCPNVFASIALRPAHRAYAVDAAKGRSAARASIDQRRDYGAAPCAPAGGPLSKSAERSMREGSPSFAVLFLSMSHFTLSGQKLLRSWQDQQRHAQEPLLGGSPAAMPMQGWQLAPG